MTTHATAQSALDFSKVKAAEHQLDDLLELTDTTEVKEKLALAEQAFKQLPTELNHVRLGLVYHEVALNLSFFSQSAYRGYASKSVDLLSELMQSPHTTRELLPFIASYRASALALKSAETKSLRLLSEAFQLLNDAVVRYADVCYAPEFLRGSVAENLPWLFFSKRKFAKRDFQSLIERNERTPGYASWKIMSFTYWAWARQHSGKKYKNQALAYLDKSISLDPHYEAGRKRAEELKEQMIRR